MRSLSHDLPRDGNVAFDYVQFGDFSLPAVLPRVEYAGLLFYQAPESAMQAALNRQVSMEIRRIITPAEGQKPSLHSYLFVDKGFAAGGIWERALEFDNEQHRWGIDFPLRKDGGVNRLYFCRREKDIRRGIRATPANRRGAVSPEYGNGTLSILGGSGRKIGRGSSKGRMGSPAECAIWPCR